MSFDDFAPPSYDSLYEIASAPPLPSDYSPLNTDNTDVSSEVGRTSDDRTVLQLPTGDVPKRNEGWLESIARKFCNFSEFLGQAAGFLAAFGISVGTFSIGLVVWNACHDNDNDMFTTFMRGGSQHARDFAKLITGMSDAQGSHTA